MKLRTKWHADNKQARQDYDTSVDEDAKFTHPLGVPLRTTLVTLMLEIMQKEVADGNGAADLKGILALGSEILTKTIFRIKPRYYKPMTDRAWAWSVLLSDERLEARKRS